MIVCKDFIQEIYIYGYFKGEFDILYLVWTFLKIGIGVYECILHIFMKGLLQAGSVIIFWIIFICYYGDWFPVHLGKVVGVNEGREDNSLFIDCIVALTESKPVSGFHRLQVPVVSNSFEISQSLSNGVLPMKLQYDPITLRRIRAEMKNNYEITNIDVATRIWIITLGICKWISQ